MSCPQAFDRNTGIHDAGFKRRVFRHEAEGADLTPVAGDDVDVHDGAQPDRHVAAETNGPCFDDTVLDGVTRNVHVRANHDIVAEVEQVVIADGERVDVDAPADAGTVRAQIRGPRRRSANQRTGQGLIETR